MLFKLNIHLNEDDYLSFNHFHSFQSVYGKKIISKTRNIFILTMVILIAIAFLIHGFTAFSVTFAICLLLFTLLYIIFYKKILTLNIKTQIKQLKKSGKLPFDPESTLEFYEDRMVEITPLQRTEQTYNIFERVCVVQDSYILLYKNSASAYIFPVSQIKEQITPEEFIKFLSEKCSIVEYY